MIDHVAVGNIGIGLDHHAAIVHARRSKAGEGRGRGHRGADQFGPDPVTVTVDQVIGPEGVDVAGNGDDVGIGFAQRRIEPLALGGIAVPHVQIEGDAEAGAQDEIARELIVAGRVPAQPGRHFLGEIGEVDPAHDHLVGQDAPGFARGAGRSAGVPYPGDLGRADQFAVLGTDHIALPGLDRGKHFGIAGIGVGRHRETVIEDFLIAGDQAALDQAQRGQIADLVDAIMVAQVFRLARGRPVIPGAQRRMAALGPGTLAVIVVLRAALPGIIGGLVIVPAHDPGRSRVQGLQVGIGLVLGMAGDIVGLGKNFVRRFRHPVQGLRV